MMIPRNTRLPSAIIMLITMAALMTACSKPAETAKPNNATLVNTFTAETVTLEISEDAVGTVEGLIDPTVAAEVAARVLNVAVHPGQAVKKGELLVQLDATDFGLQRSEAQAEVARVQALLANQVRLVERNQTLVQKNFISKNALDDATTQQAALKEQLAAARSRLDSVSHTGSKSRVVAPVSGVVEKQIVSPGDFVKIGDPLIQIISSQRLRVHLPYPESIAATLSPGLNVRLTTPTSPKEVIATIRELKPMIGSSNRAVDVIADVVNQPGWQPGASVNGSVIMGQHQAVVVPEQSLVLRPAGEVVYLVKTVGDGYKAEQRIVTTGVRQQGKVEIVQGLQAGEVVAVDGAAFLTDQASISVQQGTAADSTAAGNTTSSSKSASGSSEKPTQP